MISRVEAESCLARVRTLGRDFLLTDCHVHPFEVMYGGLSYCQNPGAPGVFSTGDACYMPPAAGPVGSSPAASRRQPGSKLQIQMAMLGMRRIYVHTGPECLGDQMALCGFSRALLLPVLQPGEGEDGMEAMMAMFRGDDRFLIGFCVPNGVALGEIGRNVRRAAECLGVRAVKIHSNVCRLDPRTSAGRERIEAILEASGAAGLPTIIHAGISPALHPPEAGFYGTLDALAELDFGMAAAPVIIAHGGAFGHEEEEVRNEILPRLERLFSRYDHLCSDISGLRPEILALLLERIDSGRLLFGSDALYEPIWQMAVKLMHALRQSSSDPDQEFVRIAGRNPERIFEKEFTSHVSVPADQISSVC